MTQNNDCPHCGRDLSEYPQGCPSDDCPSVTPASITESDLAALIAERDSLRNALKQTDHALWEMTFAPKAMRARLHYFGSLIAAAKFASDNGLDDSAIEQTTPSQSRQQPGIWRVTVPHKVAA